MTKNVRDSSGLITVHLLAFFFILAGSAHEASGADETLRRSYNLKSGGRITLENTRGNIRISSWDENRVEIVAEKSGDNEEDMELVPIEIDSRPDELKIKSLFPEYAPDLYVRVNYRLRVPRRVDLKLVQTVNGEIEVSEVSGRAQLLTDHGQITIKKYSGILRAESRAYGDIECELTKIDKTDHFDLQNINGGISLEVPKGVDAFWIVRTLNGTIDSDIPLEIRDNFGPHVAHRPNETGEPLIRAYSVNGNVEIEEK
jgi:DUF4097 and DUF4098 domain-containing protein YvlB